MRKENAERYGCVSSDNYGIISPNLHLCLNICCGYTLEAPHRGASNECSQHMFCKEIKKYPRVIIKYSSITSPREWYSDPIK